MELNVMRFVGEYHTAQFSSLGGISGVVHVLLKLVLASRIFWSTSGEPLRRLGRRPIIKTVITTREA